MNNTRAKKGRVKTATRPAEPISGHLQEAIERGVIEIKESKVIYSLKQTFSHNWNDPEEKVRANTIAWLVVVKDYPPNRMKTEVTVPRRTPHDLADIVVYKDDACHAPYLVVENKGPNQTATKRKQWIEQGFGNANSLRAPFMLYDEGSESTLYDVAKFPSMERQANILGPRDVLPTLYGEAPQYIFIAGGHNDITPVTTPQLEAAVRKAHSIIWSGGKRDPLSAFDEWSKLLFAKVIDERTTPTGEPRQFQVGTGETDTAVANRVRRLFRQGCREDATIFPSETKINLSDNKIAEVVKSLQAISFTRTDVDSIGAAFERFFGSIFRGGLGQYFTRRELARFVVAMLNITHEDFVIDPTAGSGGFLLEALLQVWHKIAQQFSGQTQQNRLRIDFALHHVYGIEIHEVLARICKINLLLHHDGHTNIEGDRSCLDTTFQLPRLIAFQEKFSTVIGNPPFGDSVKEGDTDKLGNNHLNSFKLAESRSKIDSEQAILERAIEMLEPGGSLGFVIPDGLLNNQGEPSNCPRTRTYLARLGRVFAVVSLPDYAFRKSGAQNKTSILFFEKYSREEQVRFDKFIEEKLGTGCSLEEAIGLAYEREDHLVFMAEANNVGYTPSGATSNRNELYKDDGRGYLLSDQSGTILGEYWRFLEEDEYEGAQSPDCMALSFCEVWRAHPSHRLDPKYHLFKQQESSVIPQGWVKMRVKEVMRRREEEVRPETTPERRVTVMTISQTGTIRPREAGKGRNPPEWLGVYFEDSPSKWFQARAGDVVYSSIDLWKGCIAVVPEEFDGALVTKEFPIYEVLDERVSPEFLAILLRSRYYQRAFRAITTGHSNRRRTQQDDFEELEICFPPTRQEQERLIAGLKHALSLGKTAAQQVLVEKLKFDDVIDGRGEERLPEVEGGPVEDEPVEDE